MDDDGGDDGIMLYRRISPVGTVGDTSHLKNRDMCHDARLKWYCRSNVQTQQMLTPDNKQVVT